MNREEQFQALVRALEHALDVASDIKDEVAIALVERALRHAHTIGDLWSLSRPLATPDAKRRPLTIEGELLGKSTGGDTRLGVGRPRV